MDIREFYRAGFEVTPENSTKFDTYPLKGKRKHQQTFKEFFINNKSLSELISNFCGLSEPLTLNWVGVFGFHSTKETENIKINQLLLKPISEKQIIDSLPKQLDKKHLKGYLDNYKNELSDKNVLIYVCGECGDFSCGGVSITISKSDDYFLWTYQSDEDEIINPTKTLTFRFDKHQYFATLDEYIRTK